MRDEARFRYLAREFEAGLNPEVPGYIAINLDQARLLADEGAIPSPDGVYPYCPSFLVVRDKRSPLYAFPRRWAQGQGIILGVKPRIVRSGILTKGDPEWTLTCPGDIDYRDIKGIEPLGQEEWDFFERLQASLQPAAQEAKPHKK